MAQAQNKVSFSAILKKSRTSHWFHYIPVSREIANEFQEGKYRRVICALNRKLQFHCALMPDGEGEFLIVVNKANRKSLGISDGDPVEVELRPDTSKYGLPLPEEFAEVLEQDDAGNRIFHALTPGRRRSLIYLVSSATSSDKRIMRAIAILEHLKSFEGKIDGRQLSELLRKRRI